jgi:hypothetical protein
VVNNAAAAWQSGLASLQSVDDGASSIQVLAEGDYQLRVV